MKPQWKAAIDFKWIRDNKDSVAVNIKNRNSNANLELVLQLYEKLLNVQKVNFLSHLFTLLKIKSQPFHILYLSSKFVI